MTAAELAELLAKITPEMIEQARKTPQAPIVQAPVYCECPHCRRY